MLHGISTNPKFLSFRVTGQNCSLMNNVRLCTIKMKATLTFVGKLSNKVNQRLYEVSSDGGEFVIGRLREAQCMILDPNVSRRHASVKFDGKSGNWTVTDNKVRKLFVKSLFSE